MVREIAHHDLFLLSQCAALAVADGRSKRSSRGLEDMSLCDDDDGIATLAQCFAHSIDTTAMRNSEYTKSAECHIM